MFHYRIISYPDFSIDKKVLDSIFIVMSHNIPKDQNGTINIVFLDDGSIKNLNNKYRKKNESTDVLSFHYHDDFSQLEGSDIA